MSKKPVLHTITLLVIGSDNLTEETHRLLYEEPDFISTFESREPEMIVVVPDFDDNDLMVQSDIEKIKDKCPDLFVIIQSAFSKGYWGIHIAPHNDINYLFQVY
jgi:hypothetical protein